MAVRRGVLRLAAWALAATAAACAPRQARVVPEPAGLTDEARTEARLSAMRLAGPELFDLLRRMPKGGDLHSHLSGSIYAESYILWAADSGLCLVRVTMSLAPPPCDADGRPPMTLALTDRALYRAIVDAWSMRNWRRSGESGHDHFFDAFARFGPATTGRFGEMLAENASRAAEGHVSYLESMVSPDGGRAAAIGAQVAWTTDLASLRRALQARGLDAVVDQTLAAIHEADARKAALLHCGTPDARPGCGVLVRYLFQVLRSAPPAVVFAQMMTGLAAADRPGSPIAGINLVAPEDDPVAIRDFPWHMAMLRFLAPLYPHARVTLHAGELVPGLVPPEALRSHIRDSVAAGASRIGHGVDVWYEDDATGLLEQMAERRVAVEVCLTSNDVILGVRGADHPLHTYLRYGVPVVRATDDEGVSRSEITREYWRAVVDQGLGYADLKAMARNSLEYAFIDGASLWADARRFVRASACAADTPSALAPSAPCAALLASSGKARVQWTLERDLSAFEHAVATGR